MGDLKPGTIEHNYRRILERIEEAAHPAGHDPDTIRVVVVTKTHPAACVRAAIQAGLRTFGENYAEEGIEKKLALGEPPGIAWHMIGHIQSRKAKMVCEHYDTVHSLDSLRLARRLDRFCGEAGRRLPVLLECNVSGEESKYGWTAWNESGWGRLAEAIEPVLALPNLEVRGLMTIAPFLPDPEEARPYFSRLRRLRDFLAIRLPEAGWDELSMGMSADFEVAVQEGATIVRIGTAIMGERE